MSFRSTVEVMRRVSGGLIPLLLFLSLAAAGAAASSAPGAGRAGRGTPIVVGGTLSLSGKYEEMGRMQEKGYRLWESEINRKGGLLGRPVRLLIIDDGSDPKRVEAGYRDLVGRRKVDLVVNPYSSELTLPAVAITEKAGYPMLVTSSSEKIWETPRRYSYGVYSTAGRYFIGLLEICAIKGKTKVSITGFADPFSSYSAIGAKRWAENFGLSVVHYRILESRDEKDLAAEAREIAGARPDAVIVAGYLKETVGLRRALDKAGAGEKAFAGSVGPAMPEFRGALGPLAEGVFGASQWEPDDRITYPGSRAFIADFRKAYREEPSYHAAAAYAAGKMLSDAVGTTGTLDREAIRRFIVSTEHRTIMGPFRLRNDGTQVGHRSIIVQWQRGKKEIVWPENMRTAPPVFSN